MLQKLNTSSYIEAFILEPYDMACLARLCGPLDQHLRHIEKRLEVEVCSRGNLFQITGASSAVKNARHLIQKIYRHSSYDQDNQKELTPEMLHLEIIEVLNESTVTLNGRHTNFRLPLAELAGEPKTQPFSFSERLNQSKTGGKKMPNAPGVERVEKIEIALKPGSPLRGLSINARSQNAGQKEWGVIYTPKVTIKPRTQTQIGFVDSMRCHDISFGAGPAGTGKTYLAVACAVEALEREEVSRILLVRPAVEAGEKLGFLPGDLSAKVNPYLRPLYDALYEMLGFEVVQKLIERQIIEIAPLAYMRGRTLNNSFIILDESQNTTKDQMKMFLTRFGFGSKAVITGDESQVDLPRGILSGLRHALHVLKDIEEIGITRFQSHDIVRHSLVQKVVEAYEYQEHSVNGYQNLSALNLKSTHEGKNDADA